MMHDPTPPVLRADPDQALFRVRGLSYRYADGTPALSGIDLDIARGDRIALVGHNGSGKTTLVKQLCGLLAPSAGQVAYRGRPLSGDHLDQARLEIGLLFQDPDDQLFGHTLIDDAAFGPWNQGLARVSAEEAARVALEQVGLAEMAYKAPHNLSFGQKKRAALAGILAMQPEVLILDEPTANLDPRQEEIFLNLLRHFPGTLICISHDLIFLYELCARAVVLDRGRIHHDIPLRELVSHRASLREHGLDFSFRLVEADPLHSGPSAAGPIRRPVPTLSGNAAPALVSLRSFHYRYPDGTRALSGVDLDIACGERLAIVGENGAGKTTLLSCLLGLRQGEGTFHFAGEPVTARRRKSLWRRVGMVFQDCADQLFCPSVEEEIAFGLKRLGCSVAEIRERVEAALARVRLSGFAARVPLHLSGGERKRLALACVLAMSPELLILDEPTAGLDPEGEELLLGILAGLDATLLLVSHDMFFVGELTRRTLVMHQGGIACDLPTREFMRDDALGSLNGLAFTYRRDCGSEIRELQHEHEHSHPHLHLHEHPHRHDGVVHAHPHEHAHDHPHRFVHRHDRGNEAHDHEPHRFHEHGHPGHEAEPHDHGHD
ncbi:energy-coupling factor transporter ATPase [Desulfococcus sp.]|uniref:ABC transporter ATP-binding protein n=1 Tax=Desulfococcus sp. TaxID=2025834 RepID=UPI003593784B